MIRGYPVILNDTARELLGPEAVPTMSHPIMARGDFSYLPERVPGAIANLNTCPESGPAFPNHLPRMLVNESALATGIAMHVAVARPFLERGR